MSARPIGTGVWISRTSVFGRPLLARIVGTDRVIASADCGFSSQATYKPEVHPTVIWAKFKAMAEGARLANRLTGSKP